MSVLDGSSDEYVGDFLGTVSITVGSKGVETSAIIPDGSTPPAPPTPPPKAYWVREINTLDDRSLFPGMRVVGQEGEAGAVLVFDTMGYSRVIVEMRLAAVGGTGTTWSPIKADYLGFIYRTL